MVKIQLSSLKNSRFTRLNKYLLELVTEDCFLAGGAIRSLITNEHPNDYDIFFRTKEAIADTKDALEKLGFNVVFVCPLGSLTTLKQNDIKVQLITSRFYSSVEECIDSFDFTVTCGGIDNKFLYLHEKFCRDLKAKNLRIHKLSFPSSTINRLFKYKKYGYYTADVIIDIVDRISKHDPDIIDNEFLYMD